jgi:Mn2+/Fe2+ NRAMP family transporter
MLIATKKHIMGEWVNKKTSTILGWFITGVMVVAGAAAIYSMF